ncbi:MAG: dolichyl-phosphate beta-glucosyltransferase [Patescibacteria group bacterium]
MKPFLSVIIPAYNESQRLPQTLVDVDKKLSEVEYSSEVLVVSDGSKDATAEIVRRFAVHMKNLKLIDNKENHGKGWVVRQGMMAAKGNWRLFMDADNSTTVDQFNLMLPFFKEGYDVVFGSRAVSGAKLVPPQPWYRQILGRGGNVVIQLFALPGVRDSQCGFKCFSENAAPRVFGLARVDRWGFDVEALALAKVLGYRAKEMPVTWVNDTRSTVGLKAYLSTLWDVGRIWWWLKRGSYPLNSNSLKPEPPRTEEIDSNSSTGAFE